VRQTVIEIERQAYDQERDDDDRHGDDHGMLEHFLDPGSPAHHRDYIALMLYFAGSSSAGQPHDDRDCQRAGSCQPAPGINPLQLDSEGCDRGTSSSTLMQMIEPRLRSFARSETFAAKISATR